MKKSARLFVAGVIGIVGASCAIAQVAQQPATPPPNLKGKLAISLKMDKGAYCLMEPVMCEVTIENIGTETIRNFGAEFGAQNPYKFIVKNKQGKELPTTEFYAAQLRHAEKAKREWSGNAAFEDLAAGQVSARRLAINQYVDLTNMGGEQCTVQVERFAIRSEPVAFGITTRTFDVTVPAIQQYLRENVFVPWPK